MRDREGILGLVVREGSGRRGSTAPVRLLVQGDTMTIRFGCSGCDKPFDVPESAAGKRLACKACKATTHVPRPLEFEQGDFRPHHYVFAHRLLPGLSFGGGAGAGALMAMAQSEELRTKAWGMAAEGLPGEEQLAPDGLKGKQIEVDAKLAIALVELPRAHRMAEALFVAGCYTRTARGMDFRLLTLEMSSELGGKRPHTVLGEWIPTAGSPRHLNWGPGPLDSRELFVRAARELLADPERSPAASMG